MVVWAFALVAAVIWAGVVAFLIRYFRRANMAQREGHIAHELDEMGRTDRQVESLLQRNPSSPMLLRQYVENAADRQDWPEAMCRGKIFVARARHLPTAWLTCIDVLRRAGHETEATVLVYQAARRLGQDPEILLALARQATRDGDWAEAGRRYTCMRQRFPERDEVYREATDVLMNEGRREEAEALIAEGKQRLPQSAGLWYSAAAVAERAGDWDEAIRRWEEARIRFPSQPGGFLWGAEALMQAGRAGAAATLIQQARDFFPANKSIALAVARIVPSAGEEPTSL